MLKRLVILGVGAALMWPMLAKAAVVERRDFGRLADGTLVEAITLKNQRGVSATVITYGATLQSFIAPDRAGTPADIALGYATLADYVAKPNYFGVTVGRYANRIANATFTLDGRTYKLAANNGPNSLHGGIKGFDKVVWRVLSTKIGREASVTLAYRSVDGEEGYPGNLDATVTYKLNDRGDLTIDHRARTDKPTVINMTNHALFNLAGEGNGDILSHQLTIQADGYLPVSETLIPTGQVTPVAGTAFDFRTAETIGRRIDDRTDQQIVFGSGYDHNYVLRGRAGKIRPIARVEEPASGRVLEVLSDQPGVQFYTGNFLDGSVSGKAGRPYTLRSGLALEPQRAPDAPNQPALGPSRLDPGQEYRHLMMFRVSTLK